MKMFRVFAIVASLFATSAFADLVLQPGQTQTIVCGHNGGGNTSVACLEQLSSWCYSNTSYNRDACYQKASAYCPATSFSDCVAQTADYCYRNTSMNRDQCFDSSLNTCRGDAAAMKQMIDQAILSGKLQERGVDLQSLKPLDVK
jgi:hypothetical protein